MALAVDTSMLWHWLQGNCHSWSHACMRMPQEAQRCSTRPQVHSAGPAGRPGRLSRLAVLHAHLPAAETRLGWVELQGRALWVSRPPGKRQLPPGYNTAYAAALTTHRFIQTQVLGSTSPHRAATITCAWPAPLPAACQQQLQLAGVSRQPGATPKRHLVSLCPSQDLAVAL